MTDNTEPLSKYFRQPQIYVQLPSQEIWYGPETITKTETKEHAVLPMTAMDEIAFKTPDALMNGQAVVDVIQSCIPDIKNAWNIVNYDLDTIMIALRIATYGETMDINFNVPNTKHEVSHTVNLPQLLETVRSQQIVNEVKVENGMVIKIKPLTYKDITASQLQTFQQQKVYSAVLDSNLPEDDKVKKFNESFTAMTTLSNAILMSNIDSILTPDNQTVSDKVQIERFIKNSDAKLIKEITDKLVETRAQGSIKPMVLKATEEHIKDGAPVTYEVPITFDNANFFV
jgi:hypothetical protein